MLINWFTVAAQIVNFLILVALLKRFLYGPIIEAMSAREGKIAAQLEAAQRKRQEAEQEETSLRLKIREIEDQRQEMLAEAGRQAEEHKKKLLLQVRQDVEGLRRKWVESLQREQDTFLLNFKQRIAQEVVAISRRALQEMGNLEWEQRLTEIFLERLRLLPPEEQSAIRESIRESGSELLITTAFELPKEIRQKVTAQVQEHFGRDLALRFDTSGELLAGIELLTSSRKLAWSLGDFLDTLEEDLSRALLGLEKSEAA